MAAKHGLVTPTMKQAQSLPTYTALEGSLASPGTTAHKSKAFLPWQVHQACSPCLPKGVCSGLVLSASCKSLRAGSLGRIPIDILYGTPTPDLQEALFCGECHINPAGLKAASADHNGFKLKKERRQKPHPQRQPQTPPAGTATVPAIQE